MRQIMIADDDHIFSTALQFKLRERGCRVTAAYNGLELLLQLETESPDLLVLDLMMPGLSGLKVLEEREEDPRLRSIPVVVVTSHSDSQTRARCLELGADGFFAKPLSLRKLAADVESLLSDEKQGPARRAAS